MMLAELSLAQHKYRKNTEYWDEMNRAEQVMARETALRATAEMAAKYETGKKELEIERQHNIIHRQKTQRNLFAGGVAVCVVVLALLWYMLRLRNRRNRILAEMNTTKDRFFNIISHDLKNPATAQRDALQLLIKNSKSWEVASISEYYEELLKTADGQVELLNNLLDWARVQTGRMGYSPKPFYLLARLRPDITLIGNMTQKKNITFTVEIPEDALVSGDSDMLTTIIRNLLTNAVKFTPKGGTVTLEVQAPSNSPEGEGIPPLGGIKGGLYFRRRYRLGYERRTNPQPVPIRQPTFPFGNSR